MKRLLLFCWPLLLTGCAAWHEPVSEREQRSQGYFIERGPAGSSPSGFDISDVERAENKRKRERRGY